MSLSSSAMLRSRESERCRYPASRIIVAAGSARVPLFGRATRSISSPCPCYEAQCGRAGRSKVLVDVGEVQTTADHQDLRAVEELGDLLGQGVVRLVLGGQPDLAGLLEQLLTLRVHPCLERGDRAGPGGPGGRLLGELVEQLVERLHGCHILGRPVLLSPILKGRACRSQCPSSPAPNGRRGGRPETAGPRCAPDGRSAGCGARSGRRLDRSPSVSGLTPHG